MWPSCGLGMANPALCNGMTQSPDKPPVKTSNTEQRQFVKTGTERTEHCGTRDCSPPVPVPRQTNPVHSLPPESTLSHTISQWKVMLAFSRLLRRLGPFLLGFPPKSCKHFSSPPCVPHAPSLLAFLIWSLKTIWPMQTMKLIMTCFSQVPCYLIALRSSTFLSTLFLNTLSLCSSLKARVQNSDYITRTWFYVLCTRQ